MKYTQLQYNGREEKINKKTIKIYRSPLKQNKRKIRHSRHEQLKLNCGMQDIRSWNGVITHNGSIGFAYRVASSSTFDTIIHMSKIEVLFTGHSHSTGISARIPFQLDDILRLKWFNHITSIEREREKERVEQKKVSFSKSLHDSISSKSTQTNCRCCCCFCYDINGMFMWIQIQPILWLLRSVFIVLTWTLLCLCVRVRVRLCIVLS